MKKTIGYIGLGKMGSAMILRLRARGWKVASYDAQKRGTAKTIEQLIAALPKPRIVWIMVPSGKPVDDVLGELLRHVVKGDIVIDGGNSFYEDSIARGKMLAGKGVHFLDVGVSGGPQTVQKGRPAIMVGGKKAVFEKTRPLFFDITARKSVGYMGEQGAGHFVKMAHNGIEYGMMQALAE